MQVEKMFNLEPGQIYTCDALKLTYEVINLVLDPDPCVVYRRTNGNVPPKSKHYAVQSTAPARMMGEMVRGFELREE